MEEYQSVDAARYTYQLRNGVETLGKASIIGNTIFTLIIHVYAAILLLISNIFIEIILPTLIFDICFCGGCMWLWIIAGKGQKGPIIEWLAFFIPAVLNVFLMIWQIEQFDFFDGFQVYFPINSVLLWVWIIFLLIGAIYLILLALFSILKIIIKKITLDEMHRKNRLSKAHIPIILPLLLIILAYPLTTAYVDEGTVKRTILLEDKNMNATLSVWDFPIIPIGNFQIGQTQDIDLGLLTAEQNRTLNAFAAMGTTFYAMLSISKEVQANWSIAYAKLLDAFNLTICWTIWYETIEGFPGPDHPEEWITQARRALEFVIAHNMSNVIGICCDSESETDGSPEEYWQSIKAYDDFLMEVQTNASLKHPDPKRGTFETVLCFEPRAIMDLIDGDTDIVENQRGLGLPPSSWTKYHFMLYRQSKGVNTAVLHNYNIILKEYLGVNIAAPIVGVTGTEWFAEGYFDGDYETFGHSKQEYDYDGIDGWDAMKREILYCKAMGFYTVSVFHLNSYGNKSVVEGYGFLDYYGLENIEELANEWHKPKTIEYPISCLKFELRRAGFFAPNGELVYDLQTNIEMYITRIAITLVVIGYSMWKLGEKQKK